MWKELVEGTVPPEEREEGDAFEFGPSADAGRIAAAESALGLTLPADLRALLAECDGAREPLGEWVVFGTDEIVAQTDRVRRDYADWDDRPPLEKLVMISDVMGNGDLYAVVAAPFDGFKAGEVVLFDHETAELTSEAPDLATFLRNW